MLKKPPNKKGHNQQTWGVCRPGMKELPRASTIEAPKISIRDGYSSPRTKKTENLAGCNESCMIKLNSKWSISYSNWTSHRSKHRYNGL